MFEYISIVNKHNFSTIRVNIWDYSPHSLNHLYEKYITNEDYFILYGNKND